MCYGLRTDFQGNLFEGSAALLSVSDSIKEIKTLCWCGRKATMNLRISTNGEVEKSGEQVQIGGNDRYISLCRKHWLTGQVSATSQPKTENGETDPAARIIAINR